MAKYKLSSGLATLIENPEFDNDRDAWNYLAPKLPGRYVTLYKKIDQPVYVVNRDIYLEKFNNKYTMQKYDVNNPTQSVWLPVCVGISDDKY